MRRLPLVPWLLVVSACFNPDDPAGTASDTESGTDTTTTASTTVTTVTTVDTTAMTTTASTSVSTTEDSMTEVTTAVTTTAEDTTAGDTTTTDSDAESSTTEPKSGCLDGLFADDAPPFGAASQIAMLYNSQGVEVLDVDDDGDGDVLVGDFGDSNPGQAGVYFIEGNGDGTFQGAVKLPGSDAPTVRIAAAPIADNTVDVVGMVALPPNFNLVVRRWRGNGDGTFLAPTDYADAANWDVALFDVNGDDRRDLLGTFDDGARVSIASAAEAFSAPVAYGPDEAVNGIKGGDLNEDGNGDIVTGSADQIQVLLGNGDGTFAAAIIYSVALSPIDVLAADFDGDGHLDIGATDGAIVSVLPGDGTGAFGEVTDLTVQGSTLGAATPDFDGDGCHDIAVINNTGSVSTIMGRDDFTFTDQQVFNIVPVGYPYDLAAGDVDGDQIPDIVAVTAGGGPDDGGEVFLLRSGG